MPNVRVTSSGGGSGDGVDSRAVVTGDGISPESVLAWYTGQLVQAGWRTGAPAISARVAAQFFDATDDKGGQWQGTLVVSGLNTAMNLALVMRPR